MYKPFAIITILAAFTTHAGFAAAQRKDLKARERAGAVLPERKLVREDTSAISARDLFYGSGGRTGAPDANQPFTFEKEDLDGSNPKYVVTDAKGNKWKLKMGDEARPETVATRFVWAMGYFADTDYFLPLIHVQNIPVDVKRGRKLIGPDGAISGVRLKLESKDRKKIDTWDWQDSPFTGTRELNGLRVLMAFINNWDLKTVNNAVIQTKKGERSELIYEVSDLGASFGSTRLDLGYAHDKGDLEAFRRSKFIDKVEDGGVDFKAPSAPSLPMMFNMPQYIMRRHLTAIAHHIPVADARWMGEQLGSLSSKQIEDAFRAGGYSQDEADQFTTVLADRIAQLKAL